MKKKSGIIEEFKKFITRGNVMDMAVGVIVGGAFTTIVTSLNNDIISPILGIFGGVDFSDLKLITTAFLNNAIGKLYKKYSMQELKGLLKVKNIKNKNDLELLRLVVLNAIEMS